MILEKLRDWSVLIIGSGILLTVMLFASYWPAPTGSANAPSAPPDQKAAPAQAPAKSAPPAPNRRADAQKKAAPSAPARAASAPPAHTMDHGGHAPAPAAQPAPPAQQPAQAQAPRPSSPAAPPAAPAAGGPQPAAIPAGGDATVGRQVYRKCQACHSLQPGKNTLGPSLAGILGRHAGEAPNFNYSPALKNSKVTWDVAALDAYLADPQKFIPGNKMPFPGLKTESERKNVIAYLAAASSPAGAAAAAQSSTPSPARQPPAPDAGSSAQAGSAAAAYVSDARYTLRSGIADGRMVYLGVGGAIDGQVNPVLSASEGQVVQIILLNGEGAEHDIVFPDQNARSPRITGRGASTTLVFRATQAGDYVYFCDVPGHRLAGMEGKFLVTPRPPPQTVVEADISQQSTTVPPPIGKRDPQTIRVELLAVELEGRLAQGATFGYWTFNGHVPGPMLRVRVGDTVDVQVKNSADSVMIHSVDFHAATGPGGGAAATQVDPGHEKSFKFKALLPGLYVYHCATPMVAHHIANGMYGLILVEPEEGLPPVDREFYVMQGEIYTEAPYGQRGSQDFSVEKLLNERPEYFVFNGSVGALSSLHPLKAKVGETVRIYFGVGGPNYTSSFHVIGEIFDRVYNLGSVLSPPTRGVQTVTVPPGGATIVEFKVDVPGNYVLVDHALSRAERGLVGILQVEGPPNPEIFDGVVEPGSGH
jgi:nitrite reductase (NO-forming)